MIKVSEGQSIRDLCMEVYGSINQLHKLVVDNNLRFDETPAPGTEIEYDEDVGNNTIKKYYKRNGIIPSSGAETDEVYLQLESGEYLRLESGEYLQLNE